MPSRCQLALLRLGVACCALSLAWPTAVAGQEPPTLELGAVARLRSEVLGEERRLNVFLPPGYAESKDRYPVIYLLDGSAHEDYFHATSLIDFFATYGVMPPTIVVGIANVDRKRDFTPPSDDPRDRKDVPTHGGADRFIAFLEKDLIPWVDARYRTTERRMVVGQSLAGLLATKILLEKPALFTDYLVVSPSLWWNGQELLKRAEKLAGEHRLRQRTVYLSVADEHPEMRATAQALANVLAAHPEDVRLHFDDLADENHATSLHISLYRGLRFLAKKP
jgi:predicted alpha/beta superfamily hydrolase